MDFLLRLALFAVLVSSCSQGPTGVSWGPNLAGAVYLQNTLTPAALAILAANCTSCHGTNSGPGGGYNLMDTTHLVSSGLVVPGDPTQSPLYNAISSLQMPPNSSGLDSNAQMTIENWIYSP